MYEARRDYAGATAEYFRALERDTALTRQVENRVLQLVHTDEGRDAIERELRNARSRSHLAIFARKLLRTLYLEDGKPDLAWRAAWEVDSLTQQGGLTLVTFMRQAAERGYYAVAGVAAATVLEEYPESPVRHQAEWEFARLAKRTGAWELAAERFAYMAQASPVQRYRLEAALEFAGLQQLRFDNLESADSTYTMVAAHARAGVYYGKAMLGRAAVAKARGDLAQSRAHLVALANTDPQGPIREQLTYSLGELSYYEGDLESAQDVFTGLTEDFPKSTWVNNALRQVLLLSSYAAVAPGDIKLLGRAEALAARRHYDSALALVAGLRGTALAPLAPRATVLAASWHRDAGRPDSALALWDLFTARFPEDPDAPLALISAARLCEESLERPQAALERYHKLLTVYPRSHWATVARGKIRALGGL